jgi:predicted acetyltransferase
MYNYRFFSYITVLTPTKKTKTEIVYTALRNIEPALEDQIKVIRDSKQYILNNLNNFMLVSTSGMYCLYDDNTLLCVGIIENVQMKRIITIPRFRRQGHASRLLTEFATQMYRCGLFAFSPVDPFIEPLFEKLGWIRNSGENEDGTHDYVPPEHLQRYRDYYVNQNLDLTECLRHLGDIGVKC